ncbi:MAG: hypothetical protein HY361_00525 [Candidatus Aenigmarchaeota archaeon]|nr:hypothetical protein [Candidatus Aenigmarchaeota archaeon]
MGLRDLLPESLFGKHETVELPEEEEQMDRVHVRVENLTNMADVDRFEKLLREGNILCLKTKQLQRQDLGQFQLAVQKLKRVSHNYGFDLVGTEDGYLVVTPKFARISRE